MFSADMLRSGLLQHKQMQAMILKQDHFVSFCTIFVFRPTT